MLIYKITNKLNGKSYIGQTKNLDRRVKQHQDPTRPSAINAAIIKYGFESFTVVVLGEYEDEQTLNDAEDYFIEFHNTLAPAGYNRVTGAQKRRSWSQESLSKASESKKGEKNPMFGKSKSEETRAKISAANKGKPKSEEHKRKLREANLGKKASPEVRQRMSEAAKRSVNSGRFKPGKRA